MGTTTGTLVLWPVHVVRGQKRSGPGSVDAAGCGKQGLNSPSDTDVSALSF
jgi:hypothetical protein